MTASNTTGWSWGDTSQTTATYTATYTATTTGATTTTGLDHWHYGSLPPQSAQASEVLENRAIVLANSPEELLVERIDALAEEVRAEWETRYGTPMPEDTTWFTWVRERAEVGIELGVAVCPDRATAERRWRTWVDQGVPTTVAHGRPRLPTPEEAEEAAARERAAQERAALRERERAERERERAEEAERAEELLCDHLTDEQRADWERANRFELLVGGRTYQIARGYQGNIYLMEGGARVESYCIHGDTRLPEADQVLAQKLLLESNPDEFHRVANPRRMALAGS